MRPAAVVFGWAALNAVLTSIMFAYGESLEFIGLYATAVLITVVAGVVVLLAGRRPPGWPSAPAGGQRLGGLSRARRHPVRARFLIHLLAELSGGVPAVARGGGVSPRTASGGPALASSTEVRSGPLKPEPPKPGEEKAAKTAGVVGRPPCFRGPAGKGARVRPPFGPTRGCPGDHNARLCCPACELAEKT